MTDYPTSIGTADATSISLLGHDLAGELMGQVSFGELAFWLVALRRPEPGELRVFEAVLVALADHGFTPSAIAARLTLTGAPESVQGALAAGLLGGGSRYLGRDRGLRQVPGRRAGHPRRRPARDEAGWDELAARGHPRPAGGRPAGARARPPRAQGRATRARRSCSRIAEEAGCLGPHLTLFAAIGRVHPADPGPDAAAERRRGVRGGPGRPRLRRPTCCAASRCWPGPRACSATWPRRCATRSATSIYRQADESIRYAPPQA